jgi:hypothetical protein
VTTGPAALLVHDSCPAEWDALDADPPLFASRTWLERMAHRIEGRHRWFVSAGGVGFFGSVICDPAVSLSKNPWALLFEPAEAMRILTPASVARQAAARAAAPDASAWFPALVLTYPGAECFAIGAGAARPAALSDAIGAIVDTARAEGVRSVAFLYVQPEDTPLIAALREHRLVQFPTAVRGNLRLPGSAFSDYLATLRRGPRQEVARTRRRLADNGVQVVSRPAGELSDEDLEVFVELRQQHRAKYGKRPDAESERRHLVELREHFADRVTVFTALAGDHVLVYSLLLDGGPAQHVWQIATDYQDRRSKNTYFEMAYYAIIEHAYQHERKELSFGYGTEHVKAKVGCRVDVVDSYLLALDPDRQEHARAAAATLDIA